MALISVAFIMAGLLTSLGRQFRHFVRPYFLPPSDATASAPNSLPRWPYPNLAQRAYDVAGWIMVQTNLNYIASSFVLLSFRDCIRAWHRMGWYSHILIVLAMVFFQYGGRHALRKGLEGEKKTAAQTEVPDYKVLPPSPVEQPRDEHNSSDLTWVKHAFDNPAHRDGGEAVQPDGGLMDGLMRGTETPRSETPKLKEL